MTSLPRVLSMKSLLLALALSLGMGMGAANAQDAAAAKLDAMLPALAGADLPGCALGAQVGGAAPVLRYYGMADLEHALPIRADTVFEAGSVSKQFTAAATLVLAGEHRLSLDDDIRKYLPELPDYGHVITVAELLGHTSGLRDWGEVEAMAGWPRTERVYGMADVLQVAARQRQLNFQPGSAWSYTNTGYNLLALIVERVSGSSLMAFTQAHLFAPLGMTHTQWRDDFRRIVPGRAIAYHHLHDDVFEQMMPFENTYGHAALLTTVGDLLIWNQALAQGRLGAFVSQAMQARTLLADGRSTVYARGLFDMDYRGAHAIFHDGATAGYRAWLGRFPAQHLSVAILCNADNAQPSDYAHGLADAYIGKPDKLAYTATPPASVAGIYASERDGAPLRLSLRDGRMVTDNGFTLLADASGKLAFVRADGTLATTGAVLADGRLRMDAAGDAAFYRRQHAYAPSPAELARMAGRFHSDEVPATYLVTAVAGGLDVVVEGRPGRHRLFEPVYTDAFIAGDTVLRPVRGADGAITGIRLSDDRVWNMPFTRLP